jgi:hypothetical protein
MHWSLGEQTLNKNTLPTGGKERIATNLESIKLVQQFKHSPANLTVATLQHRRRHKNRSPVSAMSTTHTEIDMRLDRT